MSNRLIVGDNNFPLDVNAFAGSNGRRMIQLTTYSDGYVQLDEANVRRLVEVLSTWLNEKVAPTSSDRKVVNMLCFSRNGEPHCIVRAVDIGVADGWTLCDDKLTNVTIVYGTAKCEECIKALEESWLE
jgi:hypothetical protein